MFLHEGRSSVIVDYQFVLQPIPQNEKKHHKTKDNVLNFNFRLNTWVKLKSVYFISIKIYKN